MVRNLRTYLEALENDAPGQVATVTRPVDPEFELAGLVRACRNGSKQTHQRSTYPLLKADDLTGYPNWSAVTNVLGTRDRIAAALDCDVDEMLPAYLERASQTIEPVEVADAPVQDVVKTGSSVDLLDIPVLSHTPAEPAPFINGAVFVCRDPERDAYNAGMYRMMRKGEQKTGVFFAQGTHAYSILKRHEERDEPMEFAAYIGHHPAAILSSQVHAADDEYEVISSLLGEPLELVDCETVDLKVPANAELVLEGEIQPNVREREGPFCGFTYLLADGRESPVANVTAITHREDPIYYDVYNPHADHIGHGVITMEADVYQRAKDSVSQVQDVHIPPECSKFVTIVQVRNEYEGLAKQAALAAISGSHYMKTVIVVDEEQDPRDLADVWWAISMKARPSRDINIITDDYIGELDPLGTTGKGWPNLGGAVDDRLIIDATKPHDVGFPEHCEPPAEYWEDIELDEWISFAQ